MVIDLLFGQNHIKNRGTVRIPNIGHSIPGRAVRFLKIKTYFSLRVSGEESLQWNSLRKAVSFVKADLFHSFFV